MANAQWQLAFVWTILVTLVAIALAVHVTCLEKIEKEQSRNPQDKGVLKNEKIVVVIMIILTTGLTLYLLLNGGAYIRLMVTSVYHRGKRFYKDVNPWRDSIVKPDAEVALANQTAAQAKMAGANVQPKLVFDNQRAGGAEDPTSKLQAAKDRLANCGQGRQARTCRRNANKTIRDLRSQIAPGA